jgi:hypothetical protein
MHYTIQLDWMKHALSKPMTRKHAVGLAAYKRWSTHTVSHEPFFPWDGCTATACQSYRIKSTHSSTNFNTWFVLFVTRQPIHNQGTISLISQQSKHRTTANGWVVYKLHDTVSVKQPAPKPCCLSLGAIPWMPAMAHHTFITRCSRAKEIALDTHYDGGAINQLIPTYLQDVGRFRDFRSNWTLSRAADARSTSSDISSASYLQLYSSFLVLEAEDPPLRSESTRIYQGHLFQNLEQATYHKLKRLHSSAHTWCLWRRDWPGNFKVIYVTLTSKHLMPKTNSCA